ncbi:hypothetical protein GQ457_17G013700 [Hibiscus cannabinus]
MVELRHSSSSLGSRAASSPMNRDEDASPLIRDHFSPQPQVEDHPRHSSRDRDRPFWWQLHSISPFFKDDPRFSQRGSRISLFVLILIAIAGLISIFSILYRLKSPYLCKKDGIVLHCPHVKEKPSLWENPFSATTSWKPCAERPEGGISELPLQNETSGYLFIHAEGGLNQQRIAICNAVVVAKIMNATLILPVLKQDQIWKDQT